MGMATLQNADLFFEAKYSKGSPCYGIYLYINRKEK
jgi:hypothetical protein